MLARPVVTAVVAEVGGILSRAAIVAREQDVPAVVGLEDARARFRTGEKSSASTAQQAP